MTWSAMLLLSTSALVSLSPAQGQERAAAGEQPAETEVSEEIVVRGISRASLRVQIELAEDALFDRWNQINGDDELDIRCRLDTYTGSRIPVRICQPNFWRAALADAGEETVRALQGGSAIAGAVFQAEALAKSRHLEAEMKRIAGEDTELLQAISRLYSLTTTLDNFGDRRAREKSTAFRVLTAAEQDLPYDAAIQAQVRVYNDPWYHVLSHPTFAIADVFGEIESVELECRQESRQLTFTPGAEWNVPAEWKPCSVIVEAGRGSAFSLYEFE